LIGTFFETFALKTLQKNFTFMTALISWVLSHEDFTVFNKMSLFDTSFLFLFQPSKDSVENNSIWKQFWLFLSVVLCVQSFLNIASEWFGGFLFMKLFSHHLILPVLVGPRWICSLSYQCSTSIDSHCRAVLWVLLFCDQLTHLSTILAFVLPYCTGFLEFGVDVWYTMKWMKNLVKS
jgi:hypothetical protein